MTGKPDRNLVPVRKGQKVWPSQKAAAKDLGVKPSAISQALARRGHLEFVGTNVSRLGNCNAPSRPVRIGPLEFRSQKRAAEELQLPRITIRRFVANSCGPAARSTVLAAAMRFAAAQEARLVAARCNAAEGKTP